MVANHQTKGKKVGNKKNIVIYADLDDLAIIDAAAAKLGLPRSVYMVKIATGQIAFADSQREEGAE